MLYRGQLFVEDQTAMPGLPVDLVLMDRELAVQQGEEILGKYPLSETSVERIGGHRFQLTIGSESLVFNADDALSFSYEGLPFIAAGGSHPTSTGFRRAFRKFLRGVGVEEEHRPLLEIVPPADESAESDWPEVEPPEPATDAAPWLEVVDTYADVSAPAPPAPTQPVHHQPSHEPHVGAAEQQEGVHPLGDPPQETAPVVEPYQLEPPSFSAVPEPPPEPAPPPAEPSPAPAPEPAASCEGRLSDGSPCPMEPLTGRSLCFTHVQQRDAAHEQVLRRSRDLISDARSVDLPDLDNVVSRLEHAVAQVHDGQLDPQQALAMASLVQAMIDTIAIGSSAD